MDCHIPYMVALGNNPIPDLEPAKDILLVEDESMSRRALCVLLRASGFHIQSAGSAEEALELLHNGAHPQIALVDLDLPGMNGLELIGVLAHQHPAIPSVLITASSRERLDEMLHDNHVPCMRKPIDFKRLLHVLPSRQLPA